jgi:hypothetical protein
MAERGKNQISNNKANHNQPYCVNRLNNQAINGNQTCVNEPKRTIVKQQQPEQQTEQQKS